ncbi:MAG: DUF5995 family protein [Halobacteriales archaeon]
MAGYTGALRLVDGRALRAILCAFRGDTGEFDPPEEPDAALVELLERPFESAAGVSDRLGRLETRLREAGDRRAVFLTIYARMTRAVREGIEGGRFNDPAWMRRYLIAFADYYRRAFLAFERGNVRAVPDPWRVAFGTATRGDALVAQDAFLGVNAHINYDLALAIRDVGIDPDRTEKHADHRAIDGILSRILDAQQDALAELYATGIEDADAALGRLDETLTLRSMTEGREQAWRVAEVLTDARVPPIPSCTRWVLRATATGGAFFIRGPALDPSVVRRLREVEDDGVDAILERIHQRLEGA